jgi:hypothetical protein
MYCYTQISNLICVFNELQLWSEISSEHPIFIKTVSDLTKKNLPPSIVEKLLHINSIFTSLGNDTLGLKKSITPNPRLNYKYTEQIKILINRFLKNDEYVLSVIPEIRQYGRDDNVWQTLLEHITHEQKFMYNLFTDLSSQLEK